MKKLTNIITEANESKDKTFSQLKKGDKIYYLDMFNSDRNHKIEVCTVITNMYHESVSYNGMYVREHFELKFTRDNKKKDGSAVIWKENWDKKLYADTVFKPADIDAYHYISTDRELLNEFQEKLIDSDIKEVEKEIEKLHAEYDKKVQKLNDEINNLIQKKVDKYED